MRWIWLKPSCSWVFVIYIFYTCIFWCNASKSLPASIQINFLMALFIVKSKMSNKSISEADVRSHINVSRTKTLFSLLNWKGWTIDLALSCIFFNGREHTAIQQAPSRSCKLWQLFKMHQWGDLAIFQRLWETDNLKNQGYYQITVILIHPVNTLLNSQV